MTTRRGFLKLVVAAATTVGALKITRYAEPLLPIADVAHDWIEDRGDFYVVRVPDFKIFAREILRKPTIFLLGQQATVYDVAVDSFSNIYAPKGGLVKDCCFDASEDETEQARAVIITKSKNLIIPGAHIMSGPNSSAGIQILT